MLPAYIIEELRRREEARKEQTEQPRVEIGERPRKSAPPPEKDERGVAILPIFG